MVAELVEPRGRQHTTTSSYTNFETPTRTPSSTSLPKRQIKPQAAVKMPAVALKGQPHSEPLSPLRTT
jgi:hypothetical protein